MRTYDIINAGPKNRFTVNGRVVSNSGRIIQLQNLKRNELPTLDEARELVKMGAFDMLESIYGNVPDILSQLCRTMLIPKPGCEFVVTDFSAIEARTLAWLAGEQWVLDAFQRGEDIYCATASQMFGGIPVVKHGENSELRQKGKISVLACGYQGGVGALAAMGALDMGLKEDELQGIIDSWRDANPNIVKFWWDLEKAAIKTVEDYQERIVGKIGVEYYANTLWLVLPSGRKLAYIRPKIKPNKYGRMAITYEGLNVANKWAREETYGGKLAENCIAEGTLVLTHRGVVPIEKIEPKDFIWDGVEWVQHGGVIDKGVKETVEIITSGDHGILMTPDHKILTKEGWCESGKTEGLNWAKVRFPNSLEESWNWKMERSPVGSLVRMRKCSKCVNIRFNQKKTPKTFLRMPKEKPIKGFNWADISLPYCTGKSRKHCTRQTSVALPMYLWEKSSCSSTGLKRPKNTRQVMRVYAKSANQRSSKDSRYVPSPCVWCLAQYETAMSRSQSSRISQLWWTRNYNLRPLGTQLREFLGRYGFDMAERARDRSYRQQQRLQSRKLPVGQAENKCQKQENKQNHRFSIWENDCIRTCRENRYWSDHSALSFRPQLADRITVRTTGCPKRVYDIRNCGPRHRFAVWDSGAKCLRIVSNCTQATARDLLAEAMWRMEQAGLDIVAHVHDEVLVETPMNTISVDDVCEIMNQNPSWAEGLPLASDGYKGNYYLKS